MKSPSHFLTMSQIDRLIEERFTVSLMSNAKWERLIERLTDAFPDGVDVSYKLIHADTVRQKRLIATDFKPFFAEPTVYREVEWIEFLHRYEDWIDPNNRKTGKRIYEQDVGVIQCELQRIGQFQLETTPTGLRLYAYR